MNDRGSSLVLAIGAVAMAGALVAGAAVAVSSAVRTDVALREGRNRRLAVEGVLRQAVAGMGRLDAPCTMTPMVGVLNEVIVLVDPSQSCRLVADVDGVHLDRRLRLRACVADLDAALVGTGGGGGGGGEGPWPMDELPSVDDAGCAGSPAVEATIELMDTGIETSSRQVIVRSWVEVAP